MRFFACDPLLGLPRVAPLGYRPDRDDLLAEMQRLGVSHAIVRHRAALETSPMAGNAVIARDIGATDALLPSWFLTPDGIEPDFDIRKAVERMLAANVKVCWTDATAEIFSLQPWCSGPMYEVLQERQVPFILRYETAMANDLDQILSAFPRLRLILLSVPRVGRNRLVYPLLQRHPSLMLCLSHAYSVQQGYEDLVKTFGEDRWVWGMGYPEAEGGSAVTGLTYADLPISAKEKIAHGNIERVLSEVKA